MFSEKLEILLYKKWSWRSENQYESYLIFFNRIGRVLYTTYPLYSDVFKKELFTEISPTNEDIWFLVMAVLNNTKTRIVKNNYDKPLIIEGNQEEKHSQINVYQGGHDRQLKNLLDKYPEIYKKLISDLQL